jgi:hypothetical protein
VRGTRHGATPGDRTKPTAGYSPNMHINMHAIPVPAVYPVINRRPWFFVGDRLLEYPHNSNMSRYYQCAIHFLICPAVNPILIIDFQQAELHC